MCGQQGEAEGVGLEFCYFFGPEVFYFVGVTGGEAQHRDELGYSQTTGDGHVVGYGHIVGWEYIHTTHIIATIWFDQI